MRKVGNRGDGDQSQCAPPLPKITFISTATIRLVGPPAHRLAELPVKAHGHALCPYKARMFPDWPALILINAARFKRASLYP